MNNLEKFSAFENLCYQIHLYFMKESNKESLYHLFEELVASITSVKKRYASKFLVKNLKPNFAIQNTRVDFRALW